MPRPGADVEKSCVYRRSSGALQLQSWRASSILFLRTLGKGVDMEPILKIAASIFPEIVKFLVGDEAGKVAGKVADVVKDVSGTSDPDEARAKLKADPEKEAQLRIRLAEIAAEQEAKRHQAQAEALKATLQAEGQRRQAELDELKTRLGDVADARATFLDLAKAGSAFGWGPVIVSCVVTIGFFAILILLVTDTIKLGPDQQNESITQIINIAIGALTAGFATVINFWLGSSQGSRFKDNVSAQLQSQRTAEASRQTTEALRLSTESVQTALHTAKPEPEKKPAAAARSGEEQFRKCVDIVLGKEGGFSDHPDDNGGATNFGITIGTLRSWRDDPNLTAQDVRNLSRDEAIEIYRARYWNPMRCDMLPPGVDLMLFDFGVNAGPARAVRMLQEIVGVTQDGSVGPITLGAVGAVAPLQIVRSFAQKRLSFYRQLADWPVFGKGWTNRTNTVEQQAAAMVA